MTASNFSLPLSKRRPDMATALNEADTIERHLKADDFRTWGLVIYRCTYKSDSDWQELMRRLLWHVPHLLKFDNGLDLLSSFSPTVLEDSGMFDGATTSTIREHFKQWVVSACQQEQGVPFERAQWAKSPRYKFCLMVNEEALQSVLNAPTPESPEWILNDSAFVIFINGQWVPEELDEEELAALGPPLEDFYDPVEGCTLHDVGWMKVKYDRAQMEPCVYMCNILTWSAQYVRPPDIGFCV